MGTITLECYFALSTKGEYLHILELSILTPDYIPLRHTRFTMK